MKLRSVHQLEITSRCNLACSYCPHPQLERQKADMTRDTFEAALELIRYTVRKGTQGEVSVTGLGEGTLHPHFADWCGEIRDVIGYERLLCFSTNGIELTDELCKELRRHKVGIFISLHRPEKAAGAIELAKEYELLCDVNASFVTSAYDWAGQVKWYNSGPRIPCPYLNNGWAVVLQDGRLSTCCWDAHGLNIIGSVWSDPENLELRSFPLCDNCHHTTEAA